MFKACKCGQGAAAFDESTIMRLVSAAIGMSRHSITAFHIWTLIKNLHGRLQLIIDLPHKIHIFYPLSGYRLDLVDDTLLSVKYAVENILMLIATNHCDCRSHFEDSHRAGQVTNLLRKFRTVFLRKLALTNNLFELLRL